MYEIRNASHIELDFCFTYELCLVPNIIGVIYATLTIGAVRIVKYKEENGAVMSINFQNLFGVVENFKSLNIYLIFID